MSKSLELIYQPIPPDESSEALGSAVGRVIAESGAIAIASPYLSIEVLLPLVEGRTFRLVTDQYACFESGGNERLFGFFREHLSCIRSVRGLHAKVVLGEQAALFGSANLTMNGLCHRFEVAGVVRGDHLEELRKWFES
ncbi:MAG: hypothetical protein KF915_19210, partial [Polyangiaceae bacterium]|nr:hypothetical protein [Polyangiaceae bacterium]